MASVEAIGKPSTESGGSSGPTKNKSSGKSKDQMEAGTGKAGSGRVDTWRCPDPGCKRENQKTDQACTQCSLPSQSAQQFKKGNRWGRNARGGRGGGNSHRGGNRFPIRREPKALPMGVDPKNPIILQFQEHASLLDRKNDKYERIVKLSRDITLESKRVIFLLHRITCENDKPAVLGEAEAKLSDIQKNYWFNVARELVNEDPYKFLRAYTNGLQEYIEALSFHHYICHNELISWDKVKESLKFKLRIRSKKSAAPPPAVKPEDAPAQSEEPSVESEPTQETDDPPKVAVPEEKSPEPKNNDPGTGNLEAPTGDHPHPAPEYEDFQVLVPRTDFVLGLADLTGEVMRQAINFIGLGNTDACFDLLEFLHGMHDGFLNVAFRQDSHREMAKKTQVLQQSLRKVENACYSINVRGSEIPNKKHLADYLLSRRDETEDSAFDDEDSGF
eukprot:maker-scaffold69_size418775-snap-gene-2.25 protein:Tk03252 transcript:maker-scaffold69_size418775-snap-gene-2.25-mRNA-1 annotation:"translin-associated protein x"